MKYPRMPVIVASALIITAFLGWSIVTNVNINKQRPPSTPDVKESGNRSGCARGSPYGKPPEFSRALSIIKQRFKEKYPDFSIQYENCLNIRYKDLKNFGDGPEGIFLFDSLNSSTNNLLIYVDTSYKGYDDLLTALLLAHEIAHADQYHSEISHGNKLTCIEKEVQAFFFQAQLFSIFKPEEQSSIIYRFYYQQDKNPALQGIERLAYIISYAGRDCNKQMPCWMDKVTERIREMVESNPAYQKQCNL